ncbi:MAG: hypothetical protein KGD59_09025 [Candidatus Heimdallarchaeota archaeon]|nr:hypothetical protein [Candidatus Heimdallarchaeota archaeon]
MSLLQKYRRDETKKTTPEEERQTAIQQPKKEEKPIAPKTSVKKIERSKIDKTPGIRSRPVISATVRLELVEALNTLTDEKYLNRSKFIEDALIRTIKTEFPDIASKYGF